MTQGGKPKRGIRGPRPVRVWLDEILGGWRGKSSPRAFEVMDAALGRPVDVVDVRAAERPGEAFSAALAEMGRQWAGGAPGWVLGPVAGSWSEPGAATPIDDERAAIEAIRRAYEVPTVLVPIENSRGQRTGEVVEMPADEVDAFLRKRRRERLRPGLVAEIERRCWAATRGLCR